MTVGLALGIVVAAIMLAALPLLLQNGIHVLWATLVLTVGGLVLYSAIAFTEMPFLVVVSAAVILLLGWIASQLEKRTLMTVEESGAVSVTTVFAALMGGTFIEEVARRGSLAADWRYLFIGAGALLIMVVITVVRIWQRTPPEEVDEVASQPTTTEEEAQPAPPAAPTDQPDPFMRDVVAARQWADSEVEKAVHAHEEALDDQYSDDLKLKEQLAAFAIEQKLDEALIDLWEELKDYPAPDTQAGFDAERLKVTNVKGSRVNDRESILFSYQAHRYVLTTSQWGDVGDAYRDFTLHEDGNEVFGINCSLDKRSSPPRYAAYDIRAFKRRGHWARMLLDLHRHIRIKRDTRVTDSRYHGADKIKDQFQE